MTRHIPVVRLVAEIVKSPTTNATRVFSQREIDKLNAEGVRTMHIARRSREELERRKRKRARIGAVIG